MKRTLLLFATALLFAIQSYAQPTATTWQGKLLDNRGNAITQNNVSMTFVMFDAETGGSQLWPASGVVAKVVNVVNGLYSVQLGTGIADDIAFTAAMFDGKTPWLEVKVGTETLPRTEITTVPFALISNDLSAAAWETPGEIGKTTPNTGKFTSLETGSLKVTTGASDGKVLTSDADGNAEWENTTLSNFEESNYTYDSRTGVQLKAANAATDVDLVISPKGTGGILAQQSDGTTTGGDNRGIHAVDFQLSRGLSSQVASGSFSVIAGGYWNEANKNHAAVGGGSNNIASGSYSTIPGGKSNTAQGFGSAALGVNNSAGGMNSTVSGYNNSADGSNTFVAGSYNIANDYNETVIGRYASLGYGSTDTWNTVDRLFTVGNGSSAGERSNALALLKNGNTTIGGTLKVNSNISGAWYTFPANRGLPGQVMVTDGVGHADWTSLNDNGYLFASGNSIGLSIKVGTNDDNSLNFITNGVSRITITNAGVIAIPAMTTSGILHNNASGILSSSLIVNSDISASAAIADSKLATLSTAGKVANSATTASSTNTASTIVSRDASGNFSAGTITASLSGNATTSTHIAGGAQGSVPYQTASGTSTFLAKGTAGQVLTMNAGATAPQWSTPANGTVTSVSGTSPVNVITGTTTPVISVSVATTSSSGLLSSADKAKLDAQTTGTAPGQMQYWNGTAWVTVAAGTVGQLLTINSSGIPEWQSQLSIITASTLTPTMSSSGVTFKGLFNPNNLNSAVSFEYGTTTSYGNTTETTFYNPFSTNTITSSTLITGLTVGTNYHVRMITQTILGTFYSNDITFTYLYPGAPLYLGATYQEGFVFYLDGTGQHGKVCAFYDQSAAATWYDAFDICAAYSGGTVAPFIYDDWYLPSSNDLTLMYNNLKLNNLGSFSSSFYWSFETFDETQALYVNFENGNVAFGDKNANYKVRAVRDF